MISNRRIYITGLVFVIFVTTLCSTYVKRSVIVEAFFKNKIAQFEEKQDVKIGLGKISMKGLKLINFKDLTLQSPQNDTILHISSAQVRINPLRVIRGSRQIEEANINQIKLSLTQIDGYKNYGFLSKQREESKEEETQNKLHEKIDNVANLYSLITSNIPNHLTINEMNINLQKEKHQLQIYLPEAKLEEGNFYSQILFKEGAELTHLNTPQNGYCILKGALGKSHSETSQMALYSVNDSTITIPFIQQKFETTLSFDSLNILIKAEKSGNDEIALIGDFDFSNLNLYQKRITSETIVCDNAQFQMTASIGANKMEIDSSSTIRINQFEIHPYLSWEKEDTIKHIVFNLHSDRFESNKLFQSIPKGLCSHLKGMETEGDLSYRLHFKIDTNEIDSLEFESALTPYNFNILKFGETDFREVNQSFTYHIYEEGQEIGNFIVGEENPNFIPVNKVSTYLTHSILYSEDGFFFAHKGFYDTAIKSSLVKNIKEKRFARGGSTISMQLVKNLWLSKEKTLARKLEEAMIVWLVENKRIVSKDRMFEIYLNIIEWGPNIYGARNASHYYFSKEPADLTIEEALFMTSIIPRPKKFMWCFDEEQNLRPYLAEYFKIVGEKLLHNEVITEDDFLHIVPNVQLKGKASLLLKGGKKEELNEEEEEDVRFYNIDKK